MLFGRNTAQWTGLLTIVSGALVTSLPLFFPISIGNVPTSSAVAFVGILTGVLGAFILFLANENLTPVNDPRLAIGQVVNAGLDNQGVVVQSDADVQEVVQVPALVEAKP